MLIGVTPKKLFIGQVSCHAGKGGVHEGERYACSGCRCCVVCASLGLMQCNACVTSVCACLTAGMSCCGCVPVYISICISSSSSVCYVLYPALSMCWRCGPAVSRTNCMHAQQRPILTFPCTCHCLSPPFPPHPAPQIPRGITAEQIRSIVAPYGDVLDLNLMPPKRETAMGE
jgi:hypothetical protein